MTFHRLINLAALLFALATFANIALYSPYYQGQRQLRQALDEGKFVPVRAGTPFAPFGGDFLSEWTAGWMVRHGDRDRFYDFEYVSEVEHDPEIVGVEFAKDQHLFLFYPPSYYVLVTPLSLLPIQLAALVWFTLMASCLIGAAVVVGRAAPELPSLFGGFLVAAILFTPTTQSLHFGQKGTLWLLIFAGVFLLLRRERPGAAGFVFGLLALKPPLAVALGLAFLWKRQWRFLAGCAAAVAASLLLSLTLGLDVCLQYVRLFTRATNFTLRTEYPLTEEHNLYGFFALWLPRDTAPAAIKGLAMLAGLAVLVLLVRLLRGPLDFRSGRFPLQFAGIVLATALVNPKLQTYDLTILLLAVLLLAWPALHQDPAFARHRLGLAGAALALYLTCLFSSSIAERLSLQLSVPVMFGVLALLAGCVPTAPGESTPAIAIPCTAS